MVEDTQTVQAVAGLGLRLLHDAGAWDMATIAAAFSRQMSGTEPRLAGAFLEGFLSGGSEVILQDQPLLQLVDEWMCGLAEEDFIESLPLLRRSLSGFDTVSRRRLMEKVKKPAQEHIHAASTQHEENPAFARALPLLYWILGITQ